MVLFTAVGNFGMVTGIQWRQQCVLKSDTCGQGFVNFDESFTSLLTRLAIIYKFFY